MSYRITLGDTTRTFRDIAEAAEYARQLSLELNGSSQTMKDNAIGRLPGGITSVESRRLELKRSGTATVDQNLPVYQTAMSMRVQTPAY